MYKDNFDELYEDYKKLISKFLNNKFVKGYEKEDLLQECLMVLDTSNKVFDEELGVKFTTFFYINMKNRISNLIKQNDRTKRPDLIFVEPDNAVFINTPADEDVEKDMDNLKIFAELVTELLKYDRGIITYNVLVLGMTMEEVARTEGISKQRVSFINKRNLKRLKNFSKNRGLLFNSKIV